MDRRFFFVLDSERETKPHEILWWFSVGSHASYAIKGFVDSRASYTEFLCYGGSPQPL
jgi:hypothetical protein